MASPLGRVQISLRLRQSIVDAYVLDILEGRSAHERATMSLRRKQPKQTNVSRCPEALLKRRKNRGGESNFYPAVRAPTRRQKEKGCQQFFAKTACVFLFQPGRNGTSARSRRTSGAICEILVGTGRRLTELASKNVCRDPAGPSESWDPIRR